MVVPTIKIPGFALVVVRGSNLSLMTSFLQRNFARDECIGLEHPWARAGTGISSNASPLTYDQLCAAVEQRLAARRLTVIVTRPLKRAVWSRLIALARRYHVRLSTIECAHASSLAGEHTNDPAKPSTDGWWQSAADGSSDEVEADHERTARPFTLSNEQLAQALVKRIPLECDGHDECGPFDIIGDIHGCFDEWLELLTQLGYRVAEAPDRDDGLGYHVQAPANRQLVLLGDLVDRGPRSRECLQLAMAMVRDGIARAVSGNHEAKLLAALRGRRRVHPGSPRARTMAELATAPAALRAELPAFLARLPCHTIFDAGRLVVAHAGINEALQGRISGAVRAFCLYGDTSGERDEQGLMIRRDWAASYRGTALVVYGHCPVARAEWVHNTIDIDTGCVFGGALTALRYPERELVQVAARQRYARPAREFIDKP